MSKIIVVAVLIGFLFLYPSIKIAYDALYEALLIPIAPSAFALVFFKYSTIFLLGFVVFAAMYFLFKKDSGST